MVSRWLTVVAAENGRPTVPVTSVTYGRAMVCLACVSPCSGRLCDRCRWSFRSAPEQIVDGLLIRGGALHEGAPRRLVHRLKYQSLLSAAEPLVESMAAQVPPWATGLVPVPRSLARRVRFGVDPSLQLAKSLGRLTGLPVMPVLRAPLWWPSHAGAGNGNRSPVGFRAVAVPVSTYVLVDDVATTGATMLSGREAMEGIPTLAIAATVRGRVTTGSEPSPIRR